MKYFITSILIVIALFFGCKDKSAPEVQTDTIPKAENVSAGREKEYEPKLPTITVEIAGHRLVAEVADEPEERAVGLMYRSFIPDTIGMLFVFQEEALNPFWMKNTSIHLSIAFIDRDSIITDIKWMKPHDENRCFPSRPVLYALEANRGWFVKRGIKPGIKVEF